MATRLLSALLSLPSRSWGDIVYVEVETVGKALAAETVFGTVEAVKRCRPYLPVAGTILEVNPELASHPDLVNSDPYGKGWMIRMTVKDSRRPGQADGRGCLRQDRTLIILHYLIVESFKYWEYLRPIQSRN